ncbi:hypothetical protein [Candidatus Entotheonella palauensis]|uniref:hypothetical protein n=1 Tax=Candidatus Entotheonella palauensis TaxID=93172 RepID=UPI001178106C|nr:hypothetical protein [Candidatus Entotheonella palauensis]
MKNSASRILTTHVGSLVRPPTLMETLRAKESGRAYDPDELAAQVRRSIQEVVRKQAEVGIDIPSDGEYSKPNFSGYVNERLSGFERRPRNPNEIFHHSCPQKSPQEFEQSLVANPFGRPSHDHSFWLFCRCPSVRFMFYSPLSIVQAFNQRSRFSLSVGSVFRPWSASRTSPTA